MMQVLAFNGYSGSYIGDIHTVAVSQDSLVLLRKKGIEHSYIFDWRKREDSIALKMMATLRERGYWTCERIKIFHTRPRMAFGDGTPTERTTLAMHDRLTKLLKRFGATKEVKITDCPFFWQQIGVYSLQQLTTGLPNTPIIRGIPSNTWMPSGTWNGIHQQPMLLRRAEAHKLTPTVPQVRYRCPTEVYEYFASYSDVEHVPAENNWMRNRFPPLDFSNASPTLQVSIWDWRQTYQKLSVRSIPRNFERVDVALSSLQAQPRLVTEAIEEAYNALDDYPRLQKLTITVQTTDYRDELWENGEGDMLAAYIVTMLKTLTTTVRDCREPTVRNQHRDRATDIRLLVSADDWYTTEDAIQQTSVTVHEAVERYARQHNGTVTSREADTGTTLTVENINIAENCLLSATINISQLRYGRSTLDEHNDRCAREAILETLQEYLLKDAQEDA